MPNALSQLSYLTSTMQCKHQLAVLLAESLGVSRTSVVEDLTLADLLQS